MTDALFALSSCGSTKDVVSVSSINGEWNIIEVSGTAVAPAAGEELPFIVFDTATGKIFGYSVCNRMMGSFDVNAKPGGLAMGAMAGTRMACPDMETEGKILKTINEVRSFGVLSGGGIGLYDANNALVVVLEK